MFMYIGGLAWVSAAHLGTAGQARCWAPFPSILVAARQHVNFTFDEHIFSLVDTERGFWAALASLRHVRWAPGVLLSGSVFSGTPGHLPVLGGPSLSAAFIEIAFAAGYAGGVGILPLRFLQEF